MRLSEEIIMLRKHIQKQNKEIHCLKEKNSVIKEPYVCIAKWREFPGSDRIVSYIVIQGEGTETAHAVRMQKERWSRH